MGAVYCTRYVFGSSLTGHGMVVTIGCNLLFLLQTMIQVGFAAFNSMATCISTALRRFVIHVNHKL